LSLPVCTCPHFVLLVYFTRELTLCLFLCAPAPTPTSAITTTNADNTNMAEKRIRLKSRGGVQTGVQDQYADGKAAKVWNHYIGCSRSRTGRYKKLLTEVFTKYQVKSVLDVACGTGIDSIMLVEQGYSVVSLDASDKMLKYALKHRWERRKEEAFDKWIIEEGNWLTLRKDLERYGLADPFDAVICLGNSFAHLPDFSGNRTTFRTAIKNYYDSLKPGGMLVIDHRNYDYIIEKGKAPSRNLYYRGDRIEDIQTSVLFINGQPDKVILDYSLNVSEDYVKGDSDKEESDDESELARRHSGVMSGDPLEHFRLSYYPHRLLDFIDLLKGVFASPPFLQLSVPFAGPVPLCSSVSPVCLSFHSSYRLINPSIPLWRIGCLRAREFAFLTPT